MPCNSSAGMDGPSYGDIDRAIEPLQKRIAELEQALCGLCQMYGAHRDKPNTVLHPQLKEWFDRHMAQPGCVAKDGK